MGIYAEHYPDKSVIIIDKNKLIGIENEEFQKTVQECIDEGCKSISINLSNVEYIASWGIGILVYAYTTCTNKKVGFSLESPTENVMRVLHQLKLDKLFIIN
jgi:anti-anti-sigma factor